MNLRKLVRKDVAFNNLKRCRCVEEGALIRSAKYSCIYVCNQMHQLVLDDCARWRGPVRRFIY